HYFGTFPGADGIPMRNGVPTVCNKDPRTGACVRPHLRRILVDHGGPHLHVNHRADVDGGRMDGFLDQMVQNDCLEYGHPTCDLIPPTVMAYHDAGEIPNYWSYAQNFVLQDRLFSSIAAWSLPTHLGLVSGWSARCASRDPMSC